MEKLVIKIAKEFTDAPGARYRTDGDKSGEEFYEELLKPTFKEAVSQQVTLLVDMDDTWGYASSFISGSFGRLSHEFGRDIVKQYLKIKSDDDKTLIDLIENEIDQPEYKE
jgi:hypothetical protein